MTENTRDPMALTEMWLNQWNPSPWKVVSVSQYAESSGRWHDGQYQEDHITETVDLRIECATRAGEPIPSIPDDDLPGGLEMLCAERVGVCLEGDFVVHKFSLTCRLPRKAES